MTTTAIPSLKIIEDLFKTSIFDPLIEAALITLLGPLLGVPVVGSLVRYAARAFADKLFETLRLVLDVQAIAFVNEAHKKDFDKAAVTLKIIAHAKGIDSPEYKNAREHAKVALSDFARYRG